MQDRRNDSRHLLNGRRIGPPQVGYSDQPYVVVNADRSWTCTMTVSSSHEGASGQHIVSTISEDEGRTWSDFVAIEPPDGPEASWAQPLLIPRTGRIYVFYTYNRDNLREVPRVDGQVTQRVDSLGVYAYRFSDDGGRSWSKDRYEIPVRRFQIDRKNVFGGDVLFFWGVGKPFLQNGEAFVPFSKVGGFGKGFFVENEGALVASPNLATEPDPGRHEWLTLPEGEVGVRGPSDAGPIAGEFHVAPMNDGSLFGTFRTVDGYAGHAYSRDLGRSWETDWMRYRPGGRAIKNPRSANFSWRCSNGKYLYWFNNHGGDPLRQACLENGSRGYAMRNPTFLLGGIERDGQIHWSEPEIALYHDIIGLRWSYPDLIETEGKILLTETEKRVARWHEIDPDLLEVLWAEKPSEQCNKGLLADWQGPGEVPVPELPVLCEQAAEKVRFDPETGATLQGESEEFAAVRGGLTLECLFQLEGLHAGQTLFDSRDAEGRGILLQTTDRRSLRIIMGYRLIGSHGRKWAEGFAETAWETEPGGLIAGRPQQMAFVIDGGPCLISVVRDGHFEDGGNAKQFGFGRLHPNIWELGGAPRARLATNLDGDLFCVRLYGRALRTNELAANFRFYEKAGWQGASAPATR